MNRKLTVREKAMLLVLALVVIALGYYNLLLRPINEQIAEYNSAVASEQTELVTDMALVAKKNKMESALTEFRKNTDAKPIPLSDNSQKLMLELHEILADATSYSLGFSQGTKTEGYIILRPISLTFSTGTYAQSRAIIDALCESEYMNKISDLNIQTSSGRTGVQTSLVITYFEVKQ